MTIINLITEIKASKKVVFNLSRNIDVHQNSASQTNEKAIAGTTSGLIEKGETVTWQGKHFGIYLKHTSIISEMILYDYFVDEQLEGHFKSFKHEHLFSEKNGLIYMEDKLSYEVPFSVFGKIFNYLLLKNHLINFLKTRNKALKTLAEII